MRARPAVWLLLALVVAAGLALRLHLADVPLNRDEGEYAYGGRLLLDGVTPYTRLYSMRWPGIYAAYALMLAVFGSTHVGVHLGLAALGALTTVLVFLLGRRLVDPGTGLIAAAVHALVSVNEALLGFAAYSEHFVVAAALAGMLLTLRAIDRRHAGAALAAGLMLGLSITMKQPGIFFAGFALAWLAWATVRQSAFWARGAIALVTGIVLPAVAVIVWLGAAGVMDRFLFWTVTYASEYVAKGTVAEALFSLQHSVWPFVSASWGPVLLAVVGASAVAWDATARTRWPLIAGFVVTSLVAVSPGLYLRPHYILLALPAFALLAGLGATALARRASPRPAPRAAVAIVLAGVAVGLALHDQRAFLLSWSSHVRARDAYHGNPYPEALEIARYLRAHMKPEDTLAVLGSEPEIYFYARRPAATGYVYMYPLMEQHSYARTMQDDMIRELEAARPAYLVLVSVPYSWGATPRSEGRLVQWINEVKRGAYERVGIVDIVARDHTEYRWDGASAGYTPRARFWVEVLRRRP